MTLDAEAAPLSPLGMGCRHPHTRAGGCSCAIEPSAAVRSPMPARASSSSRLSRESIERGAPAGCCAQNASAPTIHGFRHVLFISSYGRLYPAATPSEKMGPDWAHGLGCVQLGGSPLQRRSPRRSRGFVVRLRGVEPPRALRPTRPSTLRVYQFRHRRVRGSILDATLADLLPSARGATLRTCVPVVAGLGWSTRACGPRSDREWI
jgi:hypothetical protein